MTLKGLDLLGLARMDVNMLCATIMPGTAIGCLLGTFGAPLPKLEALIKSRKVPAIRVHLSNGCGARNHNEERQYELDPKDLRGLKVRALGVQALALKYPAVKFYISPRLEHDEKDAKLVQHWLDMLKEHAPACTPVISAFTGVVPKGVLVEKHGNRAKADIISNDGESLSDAPSTWPSGAKVIAFGWVHTMNGRGPGDETFAPPSRRPNKAFCCKADIRYCLRWLNGLEAKPALPVKPIAPPSILKPLSEYYSDGRDPKSKRPVLIVKSNTDCFHITTLAGKKIGVAKRFPGEFNGMGRFYADALSVDLIDKAASQWVVYVSGRQSFLVNLLFRQGAMR